MRQNEIKILLQRTQIVLIAKIINIGPRPLFTSGYSMANQEVRYKVIEVLKGTYNEEEISVKHQIYKGSNEVNSKGSGLVKNIFHDNEVVILFLEVKNKDYFTSLGYTQKATPENVNLIKSLIVAVSRPQSK